MLNKWLRKIKRGRKARLIVAIAIISIILPLAVNGFLSSRGIRADSFIGFDEGYGNTVNDSEGNVTGTITNAVRKYGSNCLFGNCLYFDGTGDYISFGDDADLDFTASTNFTIEFWFRTTPATGTKVFVGKYRGDDAEGGYKVYMDSDGKVVFGVDDDSTFEPDDQAVSEDSYDDNRWHHVTAVKNGTTSLFLYIDAQKVGEDLSISATGILTNDDSFMVGMDSNGTTNPYTGFIDELKVFTTSARSENQIKTDINKGPATSGLSATFGPDTSYISNGLVGYWTMDEASGDIGDSSGNAKTLTNTNSTAFTSGVFGNAADIVPSSSNYFYGTDSEALSVSDEMTISAWVNPDVVTASTQYNIVGKWDMELKSYLLALYGDEVRLYLDSSDYYVQTISADLSTGSWYHISATFNAQTGTVNIYINGALKETSSYGTIPNNIYDDPGFFVIGSQDAGVTTEVINATASASAYDAHESDSGAGFSYTATTVDMDGNGTPGTRMNGGFYFPNVSVPKSQNIDLAYIKVWPYSTSTDSPNVSITGEDSATASDFATVQDVTSRTRVPTSVSWIDTDVGATGYVESPDLSTVVEDIVDHTNWAVGRPMVIFLDGTTTSSSFAAYSYDGNSARAATIHIEYPKQGDPKNFFDGRIDEVRVYNRSFSPSEIWGLYNWVPKPSLYWALDENTGTSSVYDSAGNSNTAVMTGTMTTDDWVDGKFGSALDFDGTNDALTILRTNDAYLDFTGREKFSGGAWVYIKDMPSTGEQDAVIVKWDNASASKGYRLVVENDDSDETGNFQIDIHDDSANQSIIATGANDTVSENTWYHIAFTFNGGIAGAANDLKLYTNGIYTATNTLNASFLGLEDSLADFTIGDYDTNDSEAGNTAFTGIIDDVKIYNYVRTPAQIVEDMNAGHPAPGSPVGSALGEWNFEEGYGDTVHNTGNGGSSLDGNLAGTGTTCPTTGACPTWTNSGKSGKALSFDGTDDYMSVPYSTSLNVSDVTLSVWVYPTAQEQQNLVFYNTASGGVRYQLTLAATGRIQAGFGPSGGTIYPTTPASIYAISNWYHVVSTYNSTTGEGKIYVNGTLYDTIISSGPLNSGDQALYIGYTSSTAWLHGSVDDFRLYNFALTEGQIKLLYNQGQSAVFGSLGTASDNSSSNSSTDSYCPPGQETACTGPVGEWKLDEKTGTSANDTSENSYTGTLTSSPLWKSSAVCKQGACLEFNGSNSFVDIGTGPTSVKTVSFWAYPSSTTEYFIDLNGTAYVWANAGTVTASGFTDPVVYVNGIKTTAISANLWQHVSITTDTAVNASDLDLGRLEGTDFFSGKLDNIIFYNYTRTPAQIAWDYNRGEALWNLRLDDTTGATAYDTGPMDTDGTLQGTAVYDSTLANCQSGYCVDLDGSNDYIVTANFSPLASSGASATNASWGGWYYLTSSAASLTLMEKASELRLSTDANSKPVCDIYTGGSFTSNFAVNSSALSLSEWNHVLCTYDGSNIKVYVNGVLMDTWAQTGSITAASSACYIGTSSGGTGDVTGSIDEQHIFSYALTREQIQTRMNKGAVRFGP